MPEGCELAFALSKETFTFHIKGHDEDTQLKRRGLRQKNSFLSSHIRAMCFWACGKRHQQKCPSFGLQWAPTLDDLQGVTKTGLTYMTDNTAYVWSWATVLIQVWYKFIKIWYRPFMSVGGPGQNWIHNVP